LETEDEFLRRLSELGDDYFEYWKYIRIIFLSEESISLFCDTLQYSELTSDIWISIIERLKSVCDDEHRSRRFVSTSTTGVRGFNSNIVKAFPTVLNEYRTCQWRLLYRGSRDGFASSQFHGKCDNVSNTITLIITTDGFIFGGFTPLAWDSSSQYKPDTSGKSFLFSIKNPHNIEAGKIALKDSRYGIYCSSSYGPVFGSGYDIKVVDDCDKNTSSYTRLGVGYANNTGVGDSQFFTGQQNFTVKEIEIFAISE
jgi:hypothetical protein